MWSFDPFKVKIGAKMNDYIHLLKTKNSPSWGQIVFFKIQTFAIFHTWGTNSSKSKIQEKYFFNLFGVEMIGKTKFPSFPLLFCEKSTEDDNKPTADLKAEKPKRPRLFGFQPTILGNFFFPWRVPSVGWATGEGGALRCALASAMIKCANTKR